MATCGVINASSKDKLSRRETSTLPKKVYFGVFFDGTGNNMIQYSDAIKFRRQQRGGSWWEPWNWNEDWEVSVDTEFDNEYGANRLGKDPIKKKSDYSNVAILHSVYQTMSGVILQEESKKHTIYRYNIYIEGAGQDEISTHTMAQDSVNMLGSGWGRGSTGVTALVSKAVSMVRMRIEGLCLDEHDEIHFDVFGFSRGAACARLFSYLVGRSERLNCEQEFGNYSAKKYYVGGFLNFLNDIKAKSKTVDFLGIFDTVPSINSEDDYCNNCTDYGLFSPTKDWVLHTFHICAMDEYRAHFGLTDIGQAVSKEGNAELFIPGCHSDVGGGYPAGVFSFTLSTGKKMYNGSNMSVPIDKTGMILRSLGWLDTEYNKTDENGRIITDDLSTLFNIGSITVSRYSKQGYNVIPLNMMALRANSKSGREGVFDMQGISETRFHIDDNLKKLYTQMIVRAVVLDGRHIINPNACGYTYHDLRRDYLHFTSTTEKNKVWNRFVHGPSYNGDTICRYLFSGNENQKKKSYVTDHGVY